MTYVPVYENHVLPGPGTIRSRALQLHIFICSSSLTGTRGHRDTSPDLEGHVHLPFPLLGLPPSVSVSPFLSFFLYLSLSLSLLLSFFVSFSPSLSFSVPSVSLCLSLPLFPFLSLSLRLSLHLYLSLPVSPFLFLPLCLRFSLPLPLSFSVSLPKSLSLSPSLSLSACLSLSFFLYLSKSLPFSLSLPLPLCPLCLSVSVLLFFFSSPIPSLPPLFTSFFCHTFGFAQSLCFPSCHSFLSLGHRNAHGVAAAGQGERHLRPEQTGCPPCFPSTPYPQASGCFLFLPHGPLSPA